MSLFARKLLSWFDLHGRHDLPWQQPRTAYRVWVSEIMLQQTQVKTVIPYFERFMKHFPDCVSLADASLDEVLALWAGLGYYNRARNLHKAAGQLIKQYGHGFPLTTEQWQALPGVGQSTAAAIVSQVYDVPVAMLDGNVKRVLCRLDAIEGWPGEKKVEQQLWQRAQALLPEQRGADYTQAIMDLGATLCTRSKPQCAACPVAALCKGSMQGIQNLLPHKKPKKKLPARKKYFVLLQKGQQLLFYRRPPTGIWGGLWSLPEFDSEQQIDAFISEQGLRVKKQPVGVEPLLHRFSHFQLQLVPVVLEVVPKDHHKAKKVMEEDAFLWYNCQQIPQGLATPVRRLVNNYLESKL